jgi:hypothetical protein
VATEINSSIAQPLPLQSNAKNSASPQDQNGTVPAIPDVLPAKDSKPVPVDTISISSQSLKATTELKKDEAKKDATSVLNNSSNKPDTPTAKVQFVYDLKGELITKYMDTADRLIYQTPSELMLQMREVASKSDSTVDMKA